MAFVARDAGVNHIYLMDVDASGNGRDPVRLTHDAEAEDYPSWSPDGTRIAYQRSLDGAAIYVVDADGANQRRLSPTPGLDVDPTWSPDGTQILYARLAGPPKPDMPPQTDLRAMSADGTGDRAILADTKFSVEPRWSTSDRIVFMSLMSGPTLDIYTIDSTGGDLQRLTSTGNNGDPVWSHDGTRISFGSDREGNGKLNVFVMTSDGSNVHQLTHFDVPDEAGDTSWSPGDGSIAFEHDVGGNKQSDPDAYAEVWTTSSDGTNPTSTTIPCSAVGCAPRWRP